MAKIKNIKKEPRFSLSNKIIFLFVSLSVTILMAGFVVEAQILSTEVKFWRTAAQYYYENYNEIKAETDTKLESEKQ